MAKTSLGDDSQRTGTSRAVVVFGNRIAPYHPLGGVETVLRSILGGDFALRLSENAAELSSGRGTTRLIVAYADTWETALSDQAADGLIAFVARGGGLLVLHNGVCWAKHPKVKDLIGASFTGHPDQAVMPYRLEGTHPIVTGLNGFEMQEEPYRYAFTSDFSADVFLRYEHEGTLWPAGWAHTHGLGRVAMLQPGHSAAAFQNTAYAALVRRAALWCAGAV
jgi:type 1 glutamine amidotransferase